jgi:arylsulfatase A-like enzyme
MKNFTYLLLAGSIIPGCISGEKEGYVDSLPNIIFILTDDQRWDALGYSGNEVIHTPEMDRLAREGIYFRNAFVTTPICAAARASFFTGLYERTHGWTFEKGEIDHKFMEFSYPALLNGTCYYTGFFGKFGVDYHLAKELFDVADIYDRNNVYHDRRGYFFKTIGTDTVHLTRYTGQQALDFIREAPEGRPFCLSLSFSAPHAHDPAPEQFFWQDYVDELYRDHIFDLPPMAEEEYFIAQPEYVRTGFNRTRWYWRFDTEEKYQQSMRGYYRMISGIDLEIGKIRNLLEEKGISGNTIIIFTSDNGYFTGERQFAGKWLMYEPSIRVPLIIYDPRSMEKIDADDFAAVTIDIPPTILEFAGVDIPPAYQGISLAGYMKGRNPAGDRKHFLIEHLWDFEHIPPSEGIRTGRWKYFRYINDPSHEELYDLLTDPGEYNNLAVYELYRDKTAIMRTRTDSLILDLATTSAD